MPIVDYNSQIAEVLNYRNLGQLRLAIVQRLGFSAQSANLPQGMAALINNFLDSANRALFRRVGVPRQKRFFTWTMAAGVKFYGLETNEEAGTGVGLRLDQYKVDWVGVERDGSWISLTQGIQPEHYSHEQQGYPQRYEIRQSIEVWPTPDDTVQYLRVLGDFGLQPFSADSDTPSVDDELVYLMALYLAKKHYRQADADEQLQVMETTLRNLVGGTHQTKRYFHGKPSTVAVVYPEPTVPFP